MLGLFCAGYLGYTGEHVSFAAGVKQCQGFRKSFTFSSLEPFLFNQIFGGFMKESGNLPGGGENCEAARRYGCRSLCVDVFGMKLWIPNFKCHHHVVFICLYIDVYLKQF